MAKRKAVPAKKQPTPAPHLDLFDIPETARRMSTTVFAVRTLIRTNKLEYVPVGHAMLIAPEFIEAYKNANKRRYSDDSRTDEAPPTATVTTATVAAPTAEASALPWPRAMRVELAAQYIGATPWAVEELCRSGEFVAYKEGKAWTVDRLELDRYVTRRHDEAANGMKAASARVIESNDAK